MPSRYGKSLASLLAVALAAGSAACDSTTTQPMPPAVHPAASANPPFPVSSGIVQVWQGNPPTSSSVPWRLTQAVIDNRDAFKSCYVPTLEKQGHQKPLGQYDGDLGHVGIQKGSPTSDKQDQNQRSHTDHTPISDEKVGSQRPLQGYIYAQDFGVVDRNATATPPEHFRPAHFVQWTLEEILQGRRPEIKQVEIHYHRKDAPPQEPPYAITVYNRGTGFQPIPGITDLPVLAHIGYMMSPDGSAEQAHSKLMADYTVASQAKCLNAP